MSRSSLEHVPFSLAPALVRALPVAAAALGLSACLVVPVDPRTGQPYTHTPTSVAVVQVQSNASPAAAQAQVLTARLYPLNAQANSAGLLTALVSDGHSGRGTFSVSYGGQMLQGEATRVSGAYGGFGRIHSDVLGSQPGASFNGQRGIANGFGGSGVNVQCEYLLTGPGIGTGACLFSDGARYQLHFG
jgi:hypothetical protein